MEDIREENIILNEGEFGEFQVKAALADMREYFGSKAYVDRKATANEQWWRIRHWDVLPDTNEGKKAGVEVGSAWLFNSLANKHADIMDSFPKPNILPREMDDEAEAKILTSITPLILEQNDYEKVYRDKGFDFVKDGACITSVLWDNSKHDGMGDVSVTNVDVHNIAWQPGVDNIQDSDKVFHVTLQDIDLCKAKWPEIADRIGPQDTGMITKYIHDDNVDTTRLTEVIDMYYKKPALVPVYMEGVDEAGNSVKIKVLDMPKIVLHLAIIVGDQLAFCSENEPQYVNGFYEHGKYPFVISRMFPIKDTPWGFGYLDIMKNPQRDIDKLDQAIIKNAMMKAKPRYWTKQNGGISKKQFANWDEELIEVATGELSDAVKKIDVDDVPAGAMNHMANKVEELKETSGNRDFSQGSTASGVTAASAIAALQEAGSKLSRDINKELYRGFREEVYLVIELIRQFYTEPRSFRLDANAADALQTHDVNRGYEIVGTGTDYRFIQYSNAGIVAKDTQLPDGTVRHKRPMFDIQVTAEKQSPFSRAAQNELIKELYAAGFFAPENAMPATVALDAMDFDGKDKLLQEIEQNNVIMQKLDAATGMIMDLAAVNPAIAEMAVSLGLIEPDQMQAQPQPGAAKQIPSQQGTPEENVARAAMGGDNSQAAKARVRAANAAAPR